MDRIDAVGRGINAIRDRMTPSMDVMHATRRRVNASMDVTNAIQRRMKRDPWSG